LSLTTYGLICSIVAGVFLLTIATSAQAAVTITKAQWNTKKAVLNVDGTGDPGVAVIVTNALNANQLLGTNTPRNNGRWGIDANNPNPVPCFVRAEQGGSVDIAAVQNAPANCAPQNQPPVCTINTPQEVVTTINVGGSVNYTGTAADADGSISSYTWTFAGGSPASANVEDPGSVTYNTAGTFTTSFTAIDNLGVSCVQQIRTIEVNAAGGGNTSINSTSASGGTPVNPVPEQSFVTDSLYRIVANNDLGMHCGDLDARISSILPPFNVLHAQVIQRGITGVPQILSEGQAQVVYSSSSNPNDPGLATSPTLAGDGTVFKTNFWDAVNIGAYDPFYPPVVTPLTIPVDRGLPVPDVERLYLGDGQLHAVQQDMPGINGPYLLNDPQPFAEHIGTLPFFINFPFGYTADVDWFEAAGVPIAAFDDFGRENAYPLMRVQAKIGGNTVATVDTVMPISAEADCQNCHAAPADGGNGAATQALVNAGIDLAFSIDDPQFDGAVPLAASVEWASDLNVLKLHDLRHGTTLETAVDPQTGLATEPVVCQRCHYTPALDLAQVGPRGPENDTPPGSGNPSNGRDQLKHKTMSNVMHAYHGQFTDLFPLMPPPNDPQRTSGPAVNDFENNILDKTCYSCHPGERTQCLRGAMFSAGVLCQDCHSNMAQVGDDFSRNVSPANVGAFELAADYYTNPDTPRVPWANEPGCGSCHTGDALDNLAGNADTIVSATDTQGNPDNIRLLQAFRVGDAKATPIVPTNKRFAEDIVTAQDLPGDPGAIGNPKLYRVSIGGQVIADLGSSGTQKSGHAGLFCEACHGSTHAEWPNINPSANDNVASNQLQGHSGTIIECNVCHESTDASLPLGLGGPHGMHPVVNDDDTRWNFQHKNYGGRSNDNCRTCHGADLKGTVLSRVAVDRVVTCKNTQGSLNCVDDGNGDLKATITKGQPVSCGMCHKQKK
jgi:hypothetical protein